MRTLIMTITLLLALLPASFAIAATPVVLPGTWEGELRREPWPIFMILHLIGDSDDLSGRVAVLGVTHPFSKVVVNGPALRIEIGAGAGALILEGSVRGKQFEGEARQGSARFPFTFQRVDDLPTPANRVEAWSQDLDALEGRFLKFERSFSHAQRALFREALQGVRERLGRMTDDQVIMALASAVSLSDNAHTRLYLVRNRTELRRLPVRLWWFRDGLYIVRATPEYANLNGCRVDLIGKTEARHARDVVSVAFAGNPSWKDYKSTYFLTSPEALRGFNLIPDEGPVPFTVSGCEAAGAISLEPLPLLKKTGAVESWWDLSPRHQDEDRTWSHVLESLKEIPLVLRRPERHYWFEFLPESGLLYFQYNRSAEESGESTKEFGERLLAALESHPVKGLVVDLRYNTGGNFELAAPLMEELLRRSAGMRRFVITGRATFSAGISSAAAWRKAGDVTLVGEPVGDALDFWSEGGNIVLPNSGLYAHFANGYHSYSTEPCPSGVACLDLDAPDLGPDLPVMSTWDEYRDGRDPAMEIIEGEMKRVKSATTLDQVKAKTLASTPQ
ncbi:MAG TPA: hypothetical protein VF701_01935 [Thermoanaerobaculia bacterium]